MGGVATVFLAMALSACNEWGPHETVSSPSDDPSLTASIRAPLLQTIGNTNLIDQPMFACSLDGQFTGPLDIAMTAGQDVDLNSVSIWLTDNVLMTATTDVNTFSNNDLQEDFVSTQIPAGTIRTLRFHTRLRGSARSPIGRGGNPLRRGIRTQEQHHGDHAVPVDRVVRTGPEKRSSKVSGPQAESHALDEFREAGP
jgi:hypothetical protein